MADNFHFGQWLRREIENREETQVAFSQRTGIAFGTLRGWLDRRCPSIRGHLIARLARGLNLPRETIEQKLAEAAGTAPVAAA
jgi:hypothetical protein